MTERAYVVLGVLQTDIYWSTPIQAPTAFEALLKWIDTPGNGGNKPEPRRGIRIVKVVSTGELIEFKFVNGRYEQQHQKE